MIGLFSKIVKSVERTPCIPFVPLRNSEPSTKAVIAVVANPANPAFLYAATVKVFASFAVMIPRLLTAPLEMCSVSPTRKT